jgi:B12 binding domain/Radical SAM superfamily
MAEIVLWNSIAKRRRSISDTFYDNGLGTLKGILEQEGHHIEIIDYAREDFFQSLTFLPLARIIRTLYKALMGDKGKLVRPVLGPIVMFLQNLSSSIQETRLKKHLQQLAGSLRSKQVKVFGIKVWYGEAFRNAAYLVEQIKKEAPEVITIAGGYHSTLYEEHLMSGSGFDFGVVGEGERALSTILSIVDENKDAWNKEKVLGEMVQAAEEGKIGNLMYRKGSQILKTKRTHEAVYAVGQPPIYTLNENKVRVHVVVESLGCPWNKCHFCVHHHFASSYRIRSIDELISEIKTMRAQGIGMFRFAGSDTPPDFGVQIARRILDEKITIIYGMGSRAKRNAKGIFDELVDGYSLMLQSGLRAIFMGGECANDYINEHVMNKGITSEDVLYSIKAFHEAKLRTGINGFMILALIYPPPLIGGITLKQVEEDNIKLLQEARPDSVMITPPGPFIHTKWNTECKKFGFELEPDLTTKLIDYEYVLYKPPHLWPNLGITLNNKPWTQILSECNDFRNKVMYGLNIPTDVADEHFLMFYGAGLRTQEEYLQAKRETMLDIISCDYSYTHAIARKVNAYSLELAGM